MKVFITGIGSVSAIGENVDETLHSLRNGKHGLKWSDEHQLMLGAIPRSNSSLREELKINNQSFSRTSLIGIKAAKEAWGKNTIQKDIRTGLISSTSVGEFDVSEEICHTHHQQQKELDHRLLTQEAGASTEKIADHLGITGYVNTLSTACSSGANAILLGARLIQSGRLDRILVGGIDPFSLHNIFGFRSLGICDESYCRPFDKRRSGLNLGEGAAFLLLENESSQHRTNNTILGEVLGWANTADAYHQTASSPDGIGASLSMQQALEISGLTSADIDYINAHGTGTENNDLSESRAIESIFGKKAPCFSSTKSYTGHTLAAAGAVEAVICILAINNGFIPPNLRFTEKIEEVQISPTDSILNKKLKYVLSNSFGFGGNCTSLIFSQP